MPSNLQKRALPDPIYDVCTFLDTATYKQSLAVYKAIMADPATTDYDLRVLGTRDRYFLLTILLKRQDALHQWLYERCREVERKPDGMLDLWARGHYKSTIITFAGIIQEILRDQEITIGIFGCTAGIAKAFLKQIKQEFESNLDLKRIYPHILYADPSKQAPTWSIDGGITVKRMGNPKECTVEAWGIVTGQPTSKHFDLAVIDDLVTLEYVNTPDMIKKTTESWEVAQNLLNQKRPRRWHIGTRYSHGDTYHTLIERGALIPRIYPATDDGTMDGHPVFLTEEQWETKKSDESSFTVACQQLQNPVAGSEQTFREEDIRYWEVRPQTMAVAILCDPAGSQKKTSDRTAIAVIGIDANHNKYALDGLCHRLKLSERWEAIKYFRAKWLRQPGVQSVKVGYEKYGMQSDIEHFNEMMKIDGKVFPIIELSWTRDGTKSKVDRVQRLQPDFQHWRFFLPYGGQKTKMQSEAEARGQSYLISKAIRQKDEQGKIYDLIEWMLQAEYRLFPAIHVDWLDAASRIYDIDLAPPKLYRQSMMEPQVVANY